MNYTLKLFMFSIIINLLLIYIFVQFVMIPINQAAKAIAQNICIAQHIKCEFK